MRSGFVTLVGRPNVGKSTLVNRMVGTKVSIVSDKVQTTRSAVRGVLSRPGAQVVFVDTPGIHRPRGPLGHRLHEAATGSIADVDVVCLVLDATASIGGGDRYVASQVPPDAVVVLNKVDRASPAQVLAQLQAAADLDLGGCADRRTRGPSGPARPGILVPPASWSKQTDSGARAKPARADKQRSIALGGEAAEPGAALPFTQDLSEYFPLSALTGEGVGALVERLVERLPEGPAYYPLEAVTDVPEAIWVAELVREQLLAVLRDELPHALATVVTEWEWPRIRCEILVERDSQKGIVIGKGGQVLKRVGTAVRQQLAPGAFVELMVRVDKDWQRHPSSLEQRSC